MKPKAEMMTMLRKERAAEAAKLGLVKLRIDQWVTPEQKARALKYLARITK
jgi:hypothetical protein